MGLVCLQPYHTLHNHLIQRVIILPQSRLEMANLCAAITAPINVVSAASTHLTSAATFQRGHSRGFHNHIGNRVWIVWWQVHSYSVLSIVAASHSDLNLCVACRINPCYSVAEILFQQRFLKCQSLSLSCWPRHDFETLWLIKDVIVLSDSMYFPIHTE